mmetsp:Transcript_89531/g.237802  ORF Transcript_89531/g.237802 Transcript_89531/m.237802 type:complete len:86 (-) Transcript_89531:85-342(-)
MSSKGESPGRKTVTICDRQSTREYDPSKSAGHDYNPSRRSEVWDNRADSDEEPLAHANNSHPSNQPSGGSADRCSDRCTDGCAVQ